MMILCKNVGFMLLGSLLLATQQPADTPSPLDEAMTRLASGHHLAALHALESAEPDSRALQMVATIRSFVGDVQGALRAFDQQNGQPPTEKPAKIADFPDDLAPANALETIVEQARDRQIVIINEAHHVPRHRAFIADLARRLREIGFTHYAAEAFAPTTDALARRGYPVRSTGFYIVEPVFGELVREVLQLGYLPIAYEPTEFPEADNPADAINGREAGQCKNLVDRIFRDNPKARVLIHVGYSHAREIPQTMGEGDELLWMATRLAQATGMNPLTIDQTTQTERGDDRFATPEWRATRDRGWLDQPVVLRSEDGKPLVTGSFAGAVDLQVFHPPTRLDQGRPNWLAEAPTRRAVEIPETLRADQAPILVQAFLDAESDDAVPADQVVLRPNEPRPVLLLRPGRYRLVVQDEHGDEVARAPLRVD